MGVLLDGWSPGCEGAENSCPHTAIPVHFNDYTVFKSPLDDFKKAVRDAGLESQVQYVNQGDIYTFDVPGGTLPDEHAKRRGVSSFSFAHLFFSHAPFYSPLFIHKSWHLSEILRICFFVSHLVYQKITLFCT